MKVRSNAKARILLDKKIMDDNLDNLVEYEKYAAKHFRKKADDDIGLTEEDILLKKKPIKKFKTKAESFMEMFMMRGQVHCNNPDSL